MVTHSAALRPVASIGLGSEQVGQPLRDDVLPNRDGLRVPHDATGRVAHVVVKLVQRDRFQPVDDLVRGPDRDRDVATDTAEGRQATDLIHEVPIGGITQDQQHRQVGNRRPRTGRPQVLSALREGLLYAAPSVGLLQPVEGIDHFLARSTRPEAEVLPVNCGHVGTTRNEEVHAGHRLPQPACRLRPLARGAVEHGAHACGAVEHRDCHALDAKH